MTHLMKTIGLTGAAVTLSVFGLAAVSNAHSTTDTPVQCEISVSQGQYGTTYEGIVHADHAAHGTYAMKISKRGSGGSSMINQSGDFSLRAGDSETVGRATFGGSPSRVNAELSVRWNGQTLTCDTDI